MIDTQLIIVEGVMGSGKSTMSRIIARRLRQAHYKTKHVPESFREHPTSVTRTLTHWRKPWLEHTSERFIKLSQQHWQAFVDTALQTRTIYVFDGQFWHGDTTSLLIANTPRQQIIDYIDAVTEIIQPLRPALIYLYQIDVTQSLERTVVARGKGFVRNQVTWKTESPYCLERGYVGKEGWLQLYRDYRQLTDELYARLSMPKLAIENSAGEWAGYEVQISTFLGLHPDNEELLDTVE